MRYTPEKITSLEKNEIFVFGSNSQGIHGKGAALTAKHLFGAIEGKGEGLQGQSFAIPTKMTPRLSFNIIRIAHNIEDFNFFAKLNPELTFLVTKIGCGLAGYQEKEIAPLFKNSLLYKNIILPETFYNANSIPLVD